MMPIHSDPGTNDVWSDAIGPVRSSRGFAWMLMQNAGAKLVFSSDWPACISISPIRGLHSAINRQTTDGKPAGAWLPEQRVTMETALRACTSAGAYASFSEKSKGVIAPGMLADLIVLSEDPFKMAPKDLYKLKVERTVIDGALVYPQ